VADTAAGFTSELILVTNVSGTTWTVTRGAESTTPVAHTAGFTVTQVVTAGALGALAGALPYASSILASAAANITFSSIPSTYNTLRVLVVGASSTAAEFDRWLAWVNGDIGAHYDLEQTGGQNASTFSGGHNAFSQWVSSASTCGDIPGASATAGVAGILELTIPNYAGTTLQKVGLWRSGYSDAAASASDQSGVIGTAAWRSTAAITSISVSTLSAANLIIGTAAYLYLT
jgi:hypothetical protein